jgi:hypothetical protein
MKKLQAMIFFFFLIMISCKDNVFPLTDYDTEMEMKKVSEEFEKFDKQLIILYKESENNPKKVIAKADSLLNANKKETDKYKSQIKPNIESNLHYLKAELFYKIGRYNESISELNFEDYRNGDYAIAYASNYIKLKDFKKAKSFIDSIQNWHGDDFALGNYYESIGKKDSALKLYEKIKKDKSIKHYAYYKWAVKRFDELNKNNPNLLNEIYFPTKNPSFEVCKSDNENRTRIFDLVQNLPESNGWTGAAILDYPQINDKDYYWVRVTTKNNEYNYYVYQKTFEIKFFNPKNKELLTLEEWRKSR